MSKKVFSIIIGLGIVLMVFLLYISSIGVEGDYVIRAANEKEEFVCTGKFYLKEKSCGIEISKITSLRMYIRVLDEHKDSVVIIQENDNNKVFYISYPTLIIEKD